MKSLQELYTEIIGSDELKKAYMEAVKGGKIAEFLKDNGCEAAEEEIRAFLKEKADQQISDAELDSVAGGACNGETTTEAIISTFSAGIACGVMALMSASRDNLHVGQRDDSEGRLCNIGK